ncbi:MAG TPA: hypothetical protein IAC36_06135 [Candidatus Aphodomonas merdavium]|nr:hypothetical protein [Candidatus Aphodomonas merdavium]
MSKTLKVLGAIVVAAVLLGTAALFAAYFLFFSAKVGTITSVKTQAQIQNELTSMLGVETNPLSGLLGATDQTASIGTNLYTVDYKNDYYLDDYLDAGIDTQEAFHNFLSKELLFSMQVSPDAYSIAGSAFSATAGNGNALAAKNTDTFLTDVGIIWTHPKHDYASVSFVDLSALGFSGSGFLQKMQVLLAPYFPQDGMNEKGLTVSLLRVYGESSLRGGETALPPTVMARVLLDKAATVDDAAALLERYGIVPWYADGDFQIYVTDASGQTLLAQYCDGELYLTHGVEAVTNYFLDEALLPAEEARTGAVRYQRLQEGLAQPLDRASAMDVLRSARSSRYEGKENAGLETVYSVVFDKTAGEIDVCFGEDFETIYTFSASERTLLAP